MSLQSSAIARRSGLKPERPVSEREHNNTDTAPTPPLEGTLASAIHAGFMIAVCPEGYPMLYRKTDPDVVFELDVFLEKFVPST